MAAVERVMAVIELKPDGTIAAVEQQSAATSKISSTMQTASVSIGAINRLVGDIAVSMDETKSSATRAADQVRTNIQSMVG